MEQETLRMTAVEQYLQIKTPISIYQEMALQMAPWRTAGFPDFIEVGNQPCFRRSNRHHHSFGIVIRLCLLLGIEVVFIPTGGPWRNGVMESFNGTYNRRSFRTQWFPSCRHFSSQSKNFELFQYKNHRYTYLKGKTPLQFIHKNGYEPILLPRKSRFSEIDYIPDGTISLIRFIQSDHRFDIFAEHFELPKCLVYSYGNSRQGCESNGVKVPCRQLPDSDG